MPTCRCIKFHVASSPILEENESEHWLAKKEDKNESEREITRERSGKEKRGGEIEKLREELRNKWNGGGGGEERRLAGIMRAVQELRNFATGIEFETCLRGSSEWRRCVPLPHSCIILAFVLTGYPSVAGGTERSGGGNLRVYYSPSLPRVSSRPVALGPRFLVPPHSTRIFHTVSTHNRFRDYSPRETSNFRRRILESIYRNIVAEEECMRVLFRFYNF